PPMLADRRLGQRAPGADGEERELPERHVLVRRRRVEERPWDHPLRKVVAALEGFAAGHDDDAAIPEGFEHRLGGGPAPHVVAGAGAAEVPRGERPLVADALENRLDEVGVLAQRAVVETPVAAAFHRPPEVWPELDGEEAGLVRPVLEDAA